MKNPTIETTIVLQNAYEYFNKELFGGELPNCLITLQRKRTSKGYFAKERFEDKKDGDKVHEIALNPDTFKDRSDIEILSTLAHEMAHCWQAEYGLKPSKNGYHNSEWVGKMAAIGLKPWSLSTGERGTGTKVTHSVTPFGHFERVCNQFIQFGNSINYASTAHVAVSKPRQKYLHRYECPHCHKWAKAHKGEKLICGDDFEMMVMVNDDGQ